MAAHVLCPNDDAHLMHHTMAVRKEGVGGLGSVSEKRTRNKLSREGEMNRASLELSRPVPLQTLPVRFLF